MQRILRASTLTFLAVLTGAAPAAAQSQPSSDVVISEFRTRGPVGGNDEYVELRNRSTSPVKISGWRPEGCSSGTPGTASGRATVGADVFQAAGIRIVDTSNTVRDGVGSPMSPCREGVGITTPAPTPTTHSSASAARRTRTTACWISRARGQAIRRTAAATRLASRRSTGYASHDIQGRQHLSPYRGSSRLRCRA